MPPVSYTHLRAHETVLDLVCRLLLEKKQHYYSEQHLVVHNSEYSTADSSIVEMLLTPG